MTVEQRTLLEMSDILGIEYTCTHCQSSYLTPLQKFERVIYQCPHCKGGLVNAGHLDSSKRSDEGALHILVEALKDIQSRNMGIKFHVSSEALGRVSCEKS